MTVAHKHMRTRITALAGAALVGLLWLTSCSPPTEDVPPTTSTTSIPGSTTSTTTTTLPPPDPTVSYETERLSVHTDGDLNQRVYSLEMSPNGRFVSYTTGATNVVAGQPVNPTHLRPFIYDRVTGQHEPIAVPDGPPLVPLAGYDPSLSEDGRFVAFHSGSYHLIPGSNGSRGQIYVRDRHLETTTLVSTSPTGVPGNENSASASISADGRYIAFTSLATNFVDGDTNGELDIYLLDRDTGDIQLISNHSDGTRANGASYTPSISPNGRYVAYTSRASNLVDGDNNGTNDIFMYDRLEGTTELVSISTSGVAGNGTSQNKPDVTDDGLVVFNSSSSNLVHHDTNGTFTDVFVRDTVNGVTEIVSINDSGEQGHTSVEPSISNDGRFIAFRSHAANLVDEDTNEVADIFIHDRQQASTKRISVHSNGAQSNAMSFGTSMSADGSTIAFLSQANNLVDDSPGIVDSNVFIHDRLSSATEWVTRPIQRQATGDSNIPSMSADGRFIAFSSTAPDLVIDDINGLEDVFVRDRVTGHTELISGRKNPTTLDLESGNGASYHPQISADGRYVSFTSQAKNLVPGDTNEAADIFVRDRLTQTTRRVTVTADGTQANDHSVESSISGDGRFVAFTSYALNLDGGMVENRSYLFVHDNHDGQIRRLSMLPAEGSSPRMSADGSTIVVHWHTNNLVVMDRLGEEPIEYVTMSILGGGANGVSGAPSISADGRFVAFQSAATNLVPNDTNGVVDVFVRDMALQTTQRISLSPQGQQGNGNSTLPSISADGRYVAFQSAATNLVPGDTNGVADIFLHDYLLVSTERVSTASDGTQANGPSMWPAINANGRQIAYASNADNLITGDTNQNTDIFLFNRRTASDLLPMD